MNIIIKTAEVSNAYSLYEIKMSQILISLFSLSKINIIKKKIQSERRTKLHMTLLSL